MDNQENAALIIVDVQNDFCPGGKLAVPNGDLVVPGINKTIRYAKTNRWTVCASQDWHPKEAKGHFKDFGGVWPEHCVQDTEGAEFHRDLLVKRNVNIFHKGMGDSEDGYSAFEGLLLCGPDEQGLYCYGFGLERILRFCSVTKVFTCGLATDYCVKATALDAQKLGFETFLLTDAIAAVNINPDDGQKAIDEMAAAGVKLTTAAEVCKP